MLNNRLPWETRGGAAGKRTQTTLAALRSRSPGRCLGRALVVRDLGRFGRGPGTCLSRRRRRGPVFALESGGTRICRFPHCDNAAGCRGYIRHSNRILASKCAYPQPLPETSHYSPLPRYRGRGRNVNWALINGEAGQWRSVFHARCSGAWIAGNLLYSGKKNTDRGRA